MKSSQAHPVAWLVLSSLLLSPPFAAASAIQELWDAPAFSLTPEALLAAANALPAEDGDDVQILLCEMLVRFEEDGRQVSTYRIIYRVLTAAGVDNWASTWAVWRPWHQQRPSLRSRVVAPGGTEHWLDPATIGETPLGDGAANMLSDRRVVEAPLPVVTVGAVIEESVEARDTQPLFARGTVGSFEFAWHKVGVHRTRLVIDAPASLPVRYATQLLGELEPQRAASGGRVVLTFEAGPLEGVESIEELAPGAVPVWPRVVFSTGESWAAVAGHYGDLVEGQLADMDLESLVSEILRDAQEREEKVARLLAWLHEEIRYTGLEFAEAAIVPRSPKETLARGYGDCKDKAALLVALLRTAGIPAQVALLNTGPGPDVVPELPGLGFFDHAIVYVPGSPELWIDPTDEFARAGELPSVDQERLALIVSPETQGLVTTPASGPEDNRFVETREVFLAADLGGARLVETTRYWGVFERFQRASLSRSAPEDLEKSFTEYMESTYSAEEFVAWEHSDPRDLSQPFELRLEAKKVGVAFTDLSHATVRLAPDALLNELPKLVLEDENDETASEDAGIAAKTRQADLVLPIPYTAEHQYRIVPPNGYRPVSLPEEEDRRLGPATLSRQVRQEEDGTVLVSFRFDTGKRRLLPAEMKALREGAQDLFGEDVLEVEFEQVAEAHLAAGEIPEALAEIERLVAAAPDKALPRTRRARALLEGGLGAAARREAEAAVELEPELYLAHQTLGLTYLRDLVGRELHKGMVNERAAAAFRRAVELEPEDEVDRRNLAVLLEHDDQGVQYGPGAPLAEAIAVHTALCDDPDATSCYEQNLLTLLARTGRFDEMLDRATRPGRATDAFTLVALAAAKGPEAALKSSRRIRDETQRQAALAAAAQSLMQLRLYPESANLFEATARGSAEPAKTLGLVGILRKVRRLEELELSASEPTDVVKRLMVSMIEGDRDALVAHLSQGARERLGKGLFADFEKELKTARRSMQEAGLSFQGMFEIGLGAMELSADGDDEVGYRVRMRGNVAGASTADVSFLVREDGGYRLAADDELPNLGHEALRRVAAGELAAARQLLDWACDLTPAPTAEDPYAGEPFFHFWTRGQAGGPEQIRAAAASLLTGDDSAEAAVPILLEGRDHAAEEERWRFERALAQAYDQLGRNEPLARLAQAWLADRPDSAAAFGYLRRALIRQDRWDELERAARQRLNAMADDPAALRALIAVASKRHDDKEERRLYQRLIDLGRANRFDYNNLAWMDVAAGNVTDQTLGLAQQAIDRGGSRAALHTLATVYAELGMSAEAREILLQAMTVGNDDAPRSDDWYVWGLIAESYGVPDFAAEAYRKVEAPEDSAELPDSTYPLARRRLEGLESGQALAREGR
ncbi:MAG TPA: DUF3857 domain-containing protein [Thermoanaerobaculia bacterium]